MDLSICGMAAARKSLNQLKTELDALEFFLWKGPVFLCEVGRRQKPLRNYCAEIY
jgi:hypothetical protein